MERKKKVLAENAIGCGSRNSDTIKSAGGQRDSQCAIELDTYEGAPLSALRMRCCGAIASELQRTLRGILFNQLASLSREILLRLTKVVRNAIASWVSV